MTAGGFLYYAEDVFCLFISIKTRRNAEGRGVRLRPSTVGNCVSLMGDIKQKSRGEENQISLPAALYMSTVTSLRLFVTSTTYNTLRRLH